MIPDDRSRARTPPVRWTLLVLHFADGSGLVSVWDEARGCAVQRDGPRHMAEASATAEHLRALAELRETGGSTNWVASLSAGAVEPPSFEAIDWSGFEAPDPAW
jgi:hypothetical protein